MYVTYSIQVVVASTIVVWSLVPCACLCICLQINLKSYECMWMNFSDVDSGTRNRWLNLNGYLDNRLDPGIS